MQAWTSVDFYRYFDESTLVDCVVTTVYELMHWDANFRRSTWKLVESLFKKLEEATEEERVLCSRAMDAVCNRYIKKNKDYAEDLSSFNIFHLFVCKYFSIPEHAEESVF